MTQAEVTPESQPDQPGHRLKSLHPYYEPKTVQHEVYNRWGIKQAPPSHTEHQPDPVREEGKLSVPVLPYVLQDFRDKARVGLDKYQTLLRTHNGRDALADAYQEAVDEVMYLKQLLLEQDFEAGVGLQDLPLDADLEQEKTRWEQLEDTRHLAGQLEAARGEASTHSKAAYYWQDRFAQSQDDIQQLLKMLRRVALQNFESTALLDLLLEMYKKHGAE